MQSMRLIGIIVCVGSLLLLSSLAVAEPQGNRLGKRAARLQERLGLSDAQAEEVSKIFQAAKQTGNCRQIENRGQRRACWQKKRQEINKQLGTVLTEEQLAKLKASRAEQRARRAERRARRAERRAPKAQQEAPKAQQEAPKAQPEKEQQ